MRPRTSDAKSQETAFQGKATESAKTLMQQYLAAGALGWRFSWGIVEGRGEVGLEYEA